ncbi:POTRA domain-containing protein [Hymenobacter sp. BT491]|uniref:POTRA domain-containing protein n=1 Tax=Hymenobacter sp. BT491 TaxID=2766779 RepID=UPI00165357EB|nr:POTRA domain-containing protein [Hymenobacter sp. BT491]MBC6989513.1 hypothetical protein [Hymenobacter sp. BT491]
MQNLRFLLVVPVVVFTWLATAAMSPTPVKSLKAKLNVLTSGRRAAQSKIGRITWQGNKAISTERLNQVLGVKTGDAYDSVALHKRLQYDPKGDITSLYMDQGYLFFSLNPQVLHRPDGSVDLTFVISEGRQAEIGNITVRGNHKVSTEEILKIIPTHSGELFSRSKLMQAQRNIAQMGPFERTRVGINPKPIMRADKPTDQVDLEFVLVEKNKL